MALSTVQTSVITERSDDPSFLSFNEERNMKYLMKLIIFIQMFKRPKWANKLPSEPSLGPLAIISSLNYWASNILFQRNIHPEDGGSKVLRNVGILLQH
jgi:hypothetical protein